MYKAVVFIIAVTILLGGLSLTTPQHATAQTGCAKTHTVQAGQNLFRIGLLYGVNWTILQAWNNLPNANSIYAGQVLCVSGPWSGGSTTPPPATAIVIYPGNPFGPTTEPRIYFPKATIGQSFELSGYNFPANRTVTISITSLGINNQYQPYYTATTDASGRFYVLVTLPAWLQNSYTVAVLATTSSGYYAKNWYFNWR
jgi:LysM repeat protein